LNKAIAVSEKAKADVFRDIKIQVAFDAVTTSLNSAFADLDETIRTNQIEDGLGATVVEVPVQAKALPPASPVEPEILDLSRPRQVVRR
jgi:hypothetical protein